MSLSVPSLPPNPSSEGAPEAILLVPAGGKGLRMGGGTPKQFRDWGGVPLLKATLLAFLAPGMPRLRAIALAVPPDRLQEVRGWDLGVPLLAVEGGSTRQESVSRALAAIRDEPGTPVLIHDAVRPFPPEAPVRAALAALEDWDGAVLAEPSTDTLKRVDADGRILATVPREEIFRAQTPQVARLGAWRAAFERAEATGFQGTDDVSLLEVVGLRVRIIPSSAANLKITTPEDWAKAPRV